MQQSFFNTEIETQSQTRLPPLTSKQTSGYNVQGDSSEESRWYCIKEILYEEYLWDMRCWHKPKFAYSKQEVFNHIIQWIKDHKAGNWTNNCGHCLYCIRKLLTMKWATPTEIVNLVLRNNKIKYYNEIGTWNNGFDD